MFIKIESNDENVDTHLFECDRFQWRVVEAGKEGAAHSGGLIREHMEPYDTGEDDPPEFVWIGQLGKRPLPIKALLITLCRRNKPSSHIVAYNCKAYAMNDEGKTFDKV